MIFLLRISKEHYINLERDAKRIEAGETCPTPGLNKCVVSAILNVMGKLFFRHLGRRAAGRNT